MNEVIEKLLFKYNDSTERQHIHLILFTEINKLLMQMTRIISIPYGHMMLVALKGQGIQTLKRLACFSQGYFCKELETVSGTTIEEWRMELKKLLNKAT